MSVEKDKNFTNGRSTTPTAIIGRTETRAIFSDFWSAKRFG
ncbi:conserved hypothetical protein [Listeria marthii FSL S4-120]|uniref:Uncharacterized protein n=1 Tax=Listeria marthii FSL S4-120 TaxID=702457 RepID=A0ABN0BTZ0_9LIST|nr:conserved hypothetical protein [Listeria marthii FSL S4-120]